VTDPDRIAIALERIADGLERITTPSAPPDAKQTRRRRTSATQRRVAVQHVKQFGEREVEVMAAWCGVHPRTVRRWIEAEEQE
jgi:DUF971 family protein